MGCIARASWAFEGKSILYVIKEHIRPIPHFAPANEKPPTGYPPLEAESRSRNVLRGSTLVQPYRVVGNLP